MAEQVSDGCQCQGLLPKLGMATRVRDMAAQVRDGYSFQGCLLQSRMAARVQVSCPSLGLLPESGMATRVIWLHRSGTYILNVLFFLRVMKILCRKL